MAEIVGPWIDDLGTNDSVLNNDHGAIPADLQPTFGQASPSGVRIVRYYLNHGFLTPTPGVTEDSFLCAFQHAVSGDNGGQWWSVDLSFAPGEHGLDPNSTPTCAVVAAGTIGPDFGGQSAGWGFQNTDGPGDYLQGNSALSGIGFRLRDWVESFGPSAGLPEPVVPDGATLEWEFDTPEILGLDAAGDEDQTLTQTCAAGSSVTWRLPGGYSVYQPNTADVALQFQYGGMPSGTPLATYTGGVGSWSDISTVVDLSDPSSLNGSSDTAFDFVASCGPTRSTPTAVSKPGTVDETRIGEWLALRLRMRARRYRFIYDDVRVTRQFPRDDGYGLIGGGRVYPPVRRGRVFGGQQ